MATGATHAGDSFAIGNHDLGQQTACLATNQIGVETDQQLACRNLVSLFDLRRKSFAFERNRIDSNVQQDLNAFFRTDGQRVSGGMQLYDRPAKRGEQLV